MKKILFALLFSLSLIACKGLMDTEPEDFTMPDDWYGDKSQLDMSLTGTYSCMREAYNTCLAVWFPTGNDLYFDRSSSNVAEKVQFFNHSTSNTDVSSTWQVLYKGINNANTFLENADRASAKVDTTVIKYMKGEALFLRTYYHFMLTAYWGDVPYREHSTQALAEGHLAVTPRAVVFEKMIADMQQALKWLPEISYYAIGGRASKSAAKGMLAKIYLYGADMLGRQDYYSEAKRWAADLMDDGIHSLNTSFEGVFVNYCTDKYDVKESILEVEAWGNVHDGQYQETGTWSTYYSPQFGGNGDDQIILVKGTEDTYIARSRGIIVTTPYLRSLYKTGDLRRDWTISTNLYKSGTNPAEFTAYYDEYEFRYPGKFRRMYEKPPVYTWGNSTNYPLLRYADVLLIFAEADNKASQGAGPSDEAIEALNQVRRRGYGKAINVPFAGVDIVERDAIKFHMLIQEERARELAFEGHRKLDLIRWGVLIERLREVGDQIRNLPLDTKQTKQNGSGVAQSSMDPLVVTFDNVARRHYLMPIPELEMTTNTKIKQNNPGW